MNLKSLLLQLLLCVTITANAAPPGDSTIEYVEEYLKLVDSVNTALKYQTGKIELEGGHAALNVPEGFKYLNKEQSKYVITQLWGNPENSAEEMVGMIFPENSNPFN